MATLDIRTADLTEIDEIIFGGGQADNAMKLVKFNDKGEFQLYDLDDERSGYLAVEDIDNLILALRKAKELWGK